MIKKICDRIKEIFSTRIPIVAFIFAAMFLVLIYQVFTLQIKKSSASDEKTEYKSTKIRDIKSTRGNIYDVNGILLAYNEVSYSIVMEESGLLRNNAEKNAMIHRLIQILDEHDVELDISFGIELDANGDFIFNLTDNALLRFKKNAYGRKSISALTEEERAADAKAVYEFLRYGNDRAAMFQISDEYSVEEALKIMAVRYTIFSNIAGTQFLIASDIDNELVVAIKENSAELPGVDIKQMTSRVYNDSMYFSHIIGYTGNITNDEIETRNEELITKFELSDEDITTEKGVSLLYNASDVVGKTGIEKSMEEVLCGVKGTVNLTVNQSGKVLSQSTNTQPVAGNDVYLSIDSELQKACYYILERNIAAILRDKLVPDMDYGTKGENANDITIPIFEVYYALLENRVIDVNHFSSIEATELEKKIQYIFAEKQRILLDQLKQILSAESTITNDKVSAELQEYLNYIYSKAVSSELLLKKQINTDDKTYIRYQNNEISMSEFFRYAITKNWISTSSFSDKDTYYSTSELYTMFLEYLFHQVESDTAFKNMIYHTLVFDNIISGKDICLLLFDQHIIEYNESSISKLQNGRISAFQFMYDLIDNLEITPGQLGLEPCSGSIVITDVNNGTTKALVTYPSYDNNMLANKIEYDYYSTLLNSSAYPLLNRPTSQVTTTGSTFKPLSALIGLGEGIVNTDTKIKDLGIFELIVPSPRCWKYPGNHGSINLSQAIMHSCNYYFYDVGFKLSTDYTGRYSDSLGISKIKRYAEMFGLTEKTGIEISEATPSVSNSDAVRTSIGYGHALAPVQIARYITGIANEGTIYNLTLLDSIRSNSGTILEQKEASVYNQITMFSNAEWAAVKKGMYNVVNTNTNSLDTLYGNLGVSVAGKTGTAQINPSTPHHALFVSFAPYENPEICVTVVIPNGYKSANAAYTAREVFGLYFNNENKAELLSGNIKAGSVTSINVSD